MTKVFHIAIDFQYRKPERNYANLEEERTLASKYGVHSCQFEVWENETMAMSYSARVGDTEAKAQAARHLLKMIIRKYKGRDYIRLLGFSMDAVEDTSFYDEYLLPYFQQ